MDILRGSEDPLANDLARVLGHWQDVKRSQGKPAGLGYEPRDIKLRGVVELISSRVLSAANGFEEVDPNQSYESLVLKYPDQFAANVIAAAKERIRLGRSCLEAFLRQDIKFLVKTSAIQLFRENGVPPSTESWIGRVGYLPKLDPQDSYAKAAAVQGFRGLVWLHEEEKDRERGRGLTALVTFGPEQADNGSQIVDATFFVTPVGKDFLEAHKTGGSLASKIYSYRPTRLWAVSDEDVDLFLSAVRAKIHLVDAYERKNPDPSDPLNLETVEETTALRQVVLRHYQSIFRKKLLAERGSRCAITGTTDPWVLEAAHIIPYAAKFADRDKPENGLLLRSDIHKLFDAHLISINPSTKTVEISSRLTSPEYASLRGVKIGENVASKSLEFHFARFLD
jgi:hypothetical protein